MDVPAEVLEHLREREGKIPPGAQAFIDILIHDSFLSCEDNNRSLRKTAVFHEPKAVWQYIAERAYLKGREDEARARDGDPALPLVAQD